ncbi:hypothetical protein COS66_03635 [Candidatus Berkelbacteria bacterium CG06_land_8_20_14_3_00_43_10]|uniref:Glycosyltransferase family 1 protein n=1 Tax=Candidatus Berkelbacteria bacterium CG10_big_fil_rev_8_21_14_0_10_43_14 TaxID=1974515 RepID=A0A2M6R8C6_9BACT|nr:MAG: hypothetical protein AUK41_01760 [Candidatus Berkelbacteria bacterium CG2_30_43_20]PIS06894.1 MAG: hypothetical protein COT79_02225 [Candidatus Berkelbacteria bacterium CG10_big_fil_rev_8_21_14_0_10_43_14]PIU86938.1 MAG: hypothetical protein COS66_03635 [Candidatus Berkelbacteria bacterium CG06_land_8_20_14_3_00_43_10]
MRIIYFIADSSHSGAPVHVADCIKGLARYPGYDIHLIAPAGWLIESSKRYAHCHTISIASVLSSGAQKLLVNAFQKLSVDNSDKTVVHIHGVRAGLFSYLSLHKFGPLHRPYTLVYTEHLYTKDYSLKNPLRGKLQKMMLRRWLRMVDHVIAVSHAVENFLLDVMHIPVSRISVIHNGVVLPKKYAHPATSNPIIGSIGSLNHIKGYEDLIIAMRFVRQKIPGVQCEIIGTGALQKTLNKQIKKLRLTDSVHLIGQPQSIDDHLSSWQLFVSTSYSESFGIAVAQAMAHKLPVIAYKVGGLPELISKESGRFIKKGDTFGLALTIENMLRNPDTLGSLGEAGFAHIQTFFTVDIMVDALRALYTQQIQLHATT